MIPWTTLSEVDTEVMPSLAMVVTEDLHMAVISIITINLTKSEVLDPITVLHIQKNLDQQLVAQPGILSWFCQ